MPGEETPATPAPAPGSSDFWHRFGQSAALVGLQIGEEALSVFVQGFLTAYAAKLAK